MLIKSLASPMNCFSTSGQKPPLLCSVLCGHRPATGTCWAPGSPGWFLPDGPWPSNFPGSHTRAGARRGTEATMLYKKNPGSSTYTWVSLGPNEYFRRYSTSPMTPALLRAGRTSPEALPGAHHLHIGKKQNKKNHSPPYRVDWIFSETPKTT